MSTETPIANAPTNPVWKGWAGHDKDAIKGELTFQEFEPKVWDEDDVDVKIVYCGICGSDYSFYAGEFGPTPDGLICGHELVGQVTRVGDQVENDLKVGSWVGIGAQSDSCRECEDCMGGEENQCQKTTITFNNPFHRANAGAAKSTSTGGFAKYWRGPSRFAIPIPSGLDPALAGPLMCGGVTVWSPLQEHGRSDKVKTVGVVGVGGLGHMAILFAKAMGKKVVAISRSESKKPDAERLGADGYIAMGEDPAEGIKGHERSLDLIICTINPPKLPIADYIPLLRPHGTIAIVGISPTPMEVPLFPLITGNRRIAGSNIGSPAELKEMLRFAADKQIKPWIQKYDMDEINRAIVDFGEGKPKYRFVLVNKDNGGQL